MNSFKSTYPALAGLILLVADATKQLFVGGETLLQKIEGEAAVIPDLISFAPQAGNLSAEIAKLKSVPADLEAAVEMLITDLAFSSDKAKAIINAAFPVAESVVAIIPQAKVLVEAIHS